MHNPFQNLLDRRFEFGDNRGLYFGELRSLGVKILEAALEQVALGSYVRLRAVAALVESREYTDRIVAPNENPLRREDLAGLIDGTARRVIVEGLVEIFAGPGAVETYRVGCICWVLVPHEEEAARPCPGNVHFVFASDDVARSNVFAETPTRFHCHLSTSSGRVVADRTL